MTTKDEPATRTVPVPQGPDAPTGTKKGRRRGDGETTGAADTAAATTGDRGAADGAGPVATVSRLAIPLLGAMGAVQGADPNIASTALIGASRGLGMSGSLLALAASISTLALSASVISTGLLADRLGRRRVLMAALAVAALGDIIVALSPSLDGLPGRPGARRNRPGRGVRCVLRLHPGRRANRARSLPRAPLHRGHRNHDGGHDLPGRVVVRTQLAPGVHIGPAGQPGLPGGRPGDSPRPTTHGDGQAGRARPGVAGSGCDLVPLRHQPPRNQPHRCHDHRPADRRGPPVGRLLRARATV